MEWEHFKDKLYFDFAYHTDINHQQIQPNNHKNKNPASNQDNMFQNSDMGRNYICRLQNDKKKIIEKCLEIAITIGYRDGISDYISCKCMRSSTSLHIIKLPSNLKQFQVKIWVKSHWSLCISWWSLILCISWWVTDLMHKQMSHWWLSSLCIRSGGSPPYP